MTLPLTEHNAIVDVFEIKVKMVTDEIEQVGKIQSWLETMESNLDLMKPVLQAQKATLKKETQ